MEFIVVSMTASFPDPVAAKQVQIITPFLKVCVCGDLFVVKGAWWLSG